MNRSARAWVVLGVLLAVWVGLGFWVVSSPHGLGTLSWLLKWALGLSVLAPAVWIAVYTVQGFLGPGKWWKSDLGTNMVWLEGAAICTNGVVAWALIFQSGDSPGEVWAYIGGLLAGVLIITWRSVIWLRAFRQEPALVTKVRELEAEVTRLRTEAGGP